MYLELKGDLSEDIKSIKEQLRKISNHGIGYGLLRYLSEEGRKRLQGMPKPEVVFNYLGQFDQVLQDEWQVALESGGVARSSFDKRTHLLEINSYITGSCLHTIWNYSRGVHSEGTVEMLAADYLNELRTLIAHCRTADESFTPSDFPLVHLSQSQLDRLSLEIDCEDDELRPIE
jgi:non-ribosomal peptide synthase protein (TIGR01720 family)